MRYSSCLTTTRVCGRFYAGGWHMADKAVGYIWSEELQMWLECTNYWKNKTKK